MSKERLELEDQHRVAHHLAACGEATPTAGNLFVASNISCCAVCCICRGCGACWVAALSLAALTSHNHQAWFQPPEGSPPYS